MAIIRRKLLEAPQDDTLRSKRGRAILFTLLFSDEPLHLLIDSTGLKIYGQGEWLDQQHGIRSRRRWRKLHLGIDANTRMRSSPPNCARPHERRLMLKRVG